MVIPSAELTAVDIPNAIQIQLAATFDQQVQHAHSLAFTIVRNRGSTGVSRSQFFLQRTAGGGLNLRIEADFFQYRSVQLVLNNHTYQIYNDTVIEQRYLNRSAERIFNESNLILLPEKSNQFANAKARMWHGEECTLLTTKLSSHSTRQPAYFQRVLLRDRDGAVLGRETYAADGALERTVYIENIRLNEPLEQTLFSLPRDTSIQTADSVDDEMKIVQALPKH